MNARRSYRPSAQVALTVAAFALGCSETRNVGTSVPHGLLPVDERNPILLANDGAYDNWQGEYAVLLANGGGPNLAGIIVNTSPPWPDLDTNIAGWRGLVTAARTSGLRNIPDPIASTGPPLSRPASGQIQDTTANRSEGAHLILEESATLSLPYRPLVVVTGGRLTDVADAYLMDPTVAERVVVVSSLGTTTDTGGAMGTPNGEMDPWADAIVTASFPFVQVSAFYDQTTDVPTARLAELPANPFGDWIAGEAAEHFRSRPGCRSGRGGGGGHSQLRHRRRERLPGCARRRGRERRARSRRRSGRPPLARDPKRERRCHESILAAAARSEHLRPLSRSRRACALPPID